jgi:signal peptidase I
MLHEIKEFHHLNGRQNLIAIIKKLWKNEYFQTLIVVVLIALIVFGFWYGSQLVLNTKIPPALAVTSGSMCIPYDGACDGWLSVSHPFERTLHKGDIVIIQGVNPQDLNVNYPDSDIIVFHKPNDPNELIVHRIIGKTEVNGTIYFSTKGDGNGNVWPQPPQSSLDPWDYSNPPGVSQDLVVGKVIMRIPWVGYIAIFMKDVLGSNSAIIGIPIIAILIILLVVIEFVVPLLRRKKPIVEQKTTTEQT